MTRGTHERCRYCGRTLDAGDAAHRRHWPFCCRRCRLAELGHWFEERYVISRRAEAVADDAGPSSGAPGGASTGEASGPSAAEGTGDNNA